MNFFEKIKNPVLKDFMIKNDSLLGYLEKYLGKNILIQGTEDLAINLKNNLQKKYNIHNVKVEDHFKNINTKALLIDLHSEYVMFHIQIEMLEKEGDILFKLNDISIFSQFENNDEVYISFDKSNLRQDIQDSKDNIHINVDYNERKISMAANINEGVKNIQDQNLNDYFCRNFDSVENCLVKKNAKDFIHLIDVYELTYDSTPLSNYLKENAKEVYIKTDNMINLQKRTQRIKRNVSYFP